jgi:uncharacterized protein (TIGR03437 family)
MPPATFCSLVLLLGAGLAWAGRVDSIVSLPNQPSVFASQRDAAGNLYIGGSVPQTHPRVPDNTDAFVAKLSSDGSKVLFRTVLSGSQTQRVNALALAPDGSILAVGITYSTDFPVTPDAAEPHSTTGDAFFARLDTNGNVAYASYLEVSAFVFPDAITTDASGAAYITGRGILASTPGTLPTISDNGEGFFLVKLGATGKQVFATGGIGGSAIALDAEGFIYVAGATGAISSYPLPVTRGAFQTTTPGFAVCGATRAFVFSCSDQYVAKLDPAASKLVYATWLTGNSGSVPASLSVDSQGNAILVGSTGSSDYPVTPGAFQTTNFAALPPVDNTQFNGLLTLYPPPNTGYVTKLNATGAGLVFSTFVGGSGQDAITSMATDSEGNFYLAGVAASPDFPGLNGLPDGCRPNYVYPVPFLTRLSADGTALTATQLAFGFTNPLVSSPSVNSVFDGQGKAVLAIGSSLATLDLFAPTPQFICALDAANRAPVAQLAPGQLISLFGTAFSLDQGASFQPENGRVPTSLGDGVSVTVSGVPAPILYSSASQINIQVPYEIAGQSSVQLEMQRSGVPLGSREFAVVASAPSVFIVGTEYATCHQTITNGLLPVAHNADGSRNSCDNPAGDESTVTLLVNGLGLAGGTPSTGAITAGPAAPLKLPISIGGNAAPVSAETDPGSVNCVWAVKVKVGSELAVPGDWLSHFTLTIGGVPLRDQFVIWTKRPGT